MMDWKECQDNELVKEAKKDENLISSLIKSSSRKFESNKRLKLDETTSGTKISIIYDSLREILETIAIKKGFKIYNHECYCSFLDEICKEKSFSDKFNRFRKIRNSINYYGEDVSVEESKQIIQEIIELREELINKFLK